MPPPADPFTGDGFAGGVGGCEPLAGVENDLVSDVVVLFANVRATTFHKYVVPKLSGDAGVHEYVEGGLVERTALTVPTSCIFAPVVPSHTS